MARSLSSIRKDRQIRSDIREIFEEAQNMGSRNLSSRKRDLSEIEGDLINEGKSNVSDYEELTERKNE